MTEELPPPLVPADVDVRDLDGFMLNVERLLASELWALTKKMPEAFRAAVGMWARAWKQTPAASLPNDHNVLAAYADMPVARLRKLWDLVMRGFILCSDGRYYHRVLAAEAMRAWERKKAYQTRRDADKKRLDEWRKKQRQNDIATPSETPSETRVVAEDTGQGQGQGRKERKKDSEPNGSGGDPPPLEAQVYRQGKRILGKSAGGQITLLRKAVGNDVEVLALLEEAERKGDSAEWIAGVIKRRGEPQTDSLGLPLTPISELGKSTDDLYRKLGVS